MRKLVAQFSWLEESRRPVSLEARTMEAGMRSEQVYWVFTVAVDQMDKFTPLIPKLVAATGKEPGALQFECNIGDDQKTADFFERYTEMRPGFSHHAEGTLPG